MRSSIFSSESFRHYAALPRAERRWHAALAAVLGIVAVVCSQVPALVYGRSGCPDGTLGSTAVASLSNRTEVLFVGSSHVLFDVRPERYSVSAMNLAATWLDYACAQRVVEKHLPRVPNLKVAVLEYDELPLVADLVPAMLGAKDLRPLTELALAPLEIPASDVFQRLQTLVVAWTFPLHTLPRLTPLGWASRRDACSPLHHPPRGFSPGYYYTEGVTPPSFDANVVFDALASSARHDDVVRRNLRALQETIAMLRHRGIAVVLLRLPHSRDYAEGRPAAVSARWRQLQAGIAPQPGVFVLDWGEKADFGPADFVDNHHLNVFGADKLARLLDPTLRRLRGETP